MNRDTLYYVVSKLRRREFPALERRWNFFIRVRKPIMPLPDFVQIEITTKCNFNCITCSRISLNRDRINRDMTFGV